MPMNNISLKSIVIIFTFIITVIVTSSKLLILVSSYYGTDFSCSKIMYITLSVYVYVIIAACGQWNLRMFLVNNFQILANYNQDWFLWC